MTGINQDCRVYMGPKWLVSCFSHWSSKYFLLWVIKVDNLTGDLPAGSCLEYAGTCPRGFSFAAWLCIKSPPTGTYTDLIVFGKSYITLHPSRRQVDIMSEICSSKTFQFSNYVSLLMIFEYCPGNQLSNTIRPGWHLLHINSAGNQFVFDSGHRHYSFYVLFWLQTIIDTAKPNSKHIFPDKI